MAEPWVPDGGTLGFGPPSSDPRVAWAEITIGCARSLRSLRSKMSAGLMQGLLAIYPSLFPGAC